MTALVDHRGANAAVWQRREDLWLTVLWDVPDEGDIDGVTRAWTRAIDLGRPYRSLVDTRRLRRVDPAAFAAITRHIQQRREDYLSLLQRQAIVRPDGLAGAITAGLLSVVNWSATISVFTDDTAALAWLCPEERDLATAYAGWIDAVTSLPQIVRRLREVLVEDLANVDVDRAARRLGASARTLQRQLLAASTSFSDELDRARVERAKELLASTDEKIGAIARAVGFQAEGRFSQRFAALTGMTPTDWRTARR